MNKYNILALGMAVGLSSCTPPDTASTDSTPIEEEVEVLSDDSLFTLIQKQTFEYFWTGAEPNSGLARERIHMDGDYPLNDEHIVTTGGSGFGMMAILVGIERNFISRKEALERFEKMADFLEKADRFHGAWPHWLDGQTGKTKAFSKKDDGGDLVETALLVQGMIAVREYFKNGNEAEVALAGRMDEMWREIDFQWYTRGENVLYWHWSPNYGWDMNFPVEGYNECLIMYVLGASSPTHPISKEVYDQGWARNGDIKSDEEYYGLPLVLDHYPADDDPVGPLFWAHYSFLGLNPKGLKDAYGDYWQLNVSHALGQYRYCVDNPENYAGYGPDCWGLTSSYSMHGYDNHHPGHDLGVIAPTAAISSMPYTPDESMAFLRNIYAPERDSLIGVYGPYDAFSEENNWCVQRYLAINQGAIPVMIENYRTGFIWNLFMEAPEVQKGLANLGFSYE